MKKLTNLIIIDASGSMSHKKSEVIGGLKQLFKQIKEDAKRDRKKVETTTIVIDFANAGDIRTLVNSSDPDDLKDSIAEGYKTRGLTALYDAMGVGFSKIPRDQMSVFVSILTDGEENDSKEYQFETIKDMMEVGRGKNWVITFMGTTEASIKKARSLGVTAGNTFTFTDDSIGVTRGFDNLEKARGYYYSASLSVTSDKDFAAQACVFDNLMEMAEEETKKQEPKKDKKDDAADNA